jgi:threonine dehydrogenase-like Zn-dependent dehydrogenase
MRAVQSAVPQPYVVRCSAHAANVKAGATVAVVGDGAVGLLGVLSAKQMGAARIIAMSRHESRQKLAREFGATDIVTERGEDGVARIKDLTKGLGADSVLECVGTQQSMTQAIGATRPGGSIGYVGVLAAVGAMLALVALMASLVPAYRALRLDPVKVLRAE